jgi:hypothetical protein
LIGNEFASHFSDTGAQCRRDVSLMTVMQTLPFCGALLQQTDAKRLDALFESLGLAVAKRNKVRGCDCLFLEFIMLVIQFLSVLLFSSR